MHLLGWDIVTEYNLNITSQSLDFILFNDSKWKDASLSDFSTGTSFTISFLVTSDDYLTLLALEKTYVQRKYYLRSDGFVSGLDVNNKPFNLTKDSVALFLNGSFVRPSCYTVTDNSIRLHTKHERKYIGSEEFKDYVNWQEGDVINFISNDKDAEETYFRTFSLESTTAEQTSVRSANGINFTSSETPILSKGKIIVLVNDEIIPYSEMVFPGGELSDEESDGALVIKRKLRTTDKVDILYFAKGFQHFEYKPKSGQTHFEGQDLYGNFLTYSSSEGAGIAQLYEYTTNKYGDIVVVGVPWSNIYGVRSNCIIHASCTVNGVTFKGKAIIQDTIFDKTTVSVQIVSEFGRDEFDSSEWYIEPAEAKSIVSYLDDRTKATTFIPELLRVFQNFFLDQYQDGLVRLSNNRNVDKVEPAVLPETLDMLGMRLDLSNMSDLNKRRAVREVVNFYKRAGTKNSINFLGYINDKVFSLEESLWTNDYINFYTPFELGATYDRKKLYDFTDYRFVSAVPTDFDDYGAYLDGNVPVQYEIEGNKILIKRGSRIFFPKHWKGVGYSMNWVYVEKDLTLDASLYAGGIWYLVLRDNNGTQSLDLLDNIPTHEDNTEFYYNAVTNAIIDKTVSLASVSLPILILNIDDQNDYTISLVNRLSTVTFVNDYIFCSIGSNFTFEYFNTSDELAKKKVTREVSQVSSVRKCYCKNYITFKSNNADPSSLDTAVVSTFPSYLYTDTGIKPFVTNCCLMLRQNKWYVYDNVSIDGEVLYNDDETFQTDDVGMVAVKYIHEGAWVKLPDLVEAEELPSVQEALSLTTDSNNRLLYKVNGVYYTFIRRESYEVLSDIVDEEGVHHYSYGFTYDRASYWVKVTRVFFDYNVIDDVVSYRYLVLDNDHYHQSEIEYETESTNILLPYIEGEVYYNSVERKHYKLSNGAWKPISFVIVGEFDRQPDVNGTINEYTDTYTTTNDDETHYVFNTDEYVIKDSISVTVGGRECVLEYDTLTKYECPFEISVFKEINENNYIIECPEFSATKQYKIFKNINTNKWYLQEQGETFYLEVLFYKDTNTEKYYIQFLEGFILDIALVVKDKNDNLYVQLINKKAGEELIIHYNTYRDTVFDKFIPYEKIYDNINNLSTYVAAEKSYRFDRFIGVSSINLDTFAVYIDGERWGVERESLNNIDPLEKKVLLRRPSKHSMYVLFGNNQPNGHGLCPPIGTKVDFYFSRNEEGYINNRWFINSITYEDDSRVRVASSYGLVSQDNLQDWVWVRTFIPPEGFYPTNHVQFNVNANNMTDSEEMESSTKYQFYELTSTPLVLDKLCHIIEFDKVVSNLGVMSLSSAGDLLRTYTEYAKFTLSCPFEGSTIEIFNNESYDYVYIVNSNGESGSVNNIDRLVYNYNTEVDSVAVENMLFNKVGDEPYICSYSNVNNFNRIPPRVSSNIRNGDTIYLPNGNEVIATVKAPGYDTVVLNLVAGKGATEYVFDSMKASYKFKVNVVSDNPLLTDEIKVYIAGKENRNRSLNVLLNSTDVIPITISVRQHGCEDFDTEINLRQDMFTDGELTYDVHLILKDIKLYLYAPDENGYVISNDVRKVSGSEFIYKYGTEITCYAECYGYKQATGTQILNITLYEDSVYTLVLEKAYYRLKVTASVNGSVDVRQPIYLNNISNTNAAIWSEGEHVVITAGGYDGDTVVVNREIIIQPNDSQNVYDIPLSEF